MLEPVSSEPVLRTLGRSDDAAYAELWRYGLEQHGHFFRCAPGDDGAPGIPTRFLSDSFSLGAFVDGKLIGITSLERERPQKLRHKALVSRMFVQPDAEGSGVGKLLLREAIVQAEALGDLRQVFLTVLATNERAQRLYAALGFRGHGSAIERQQRVDLAFRSQPVLDLVTGHEAARLGAIVGILGDHRDPLVVGPRLLVAGDRRFGKRARRPGRAQSGRDHGVASRPGIRDTESRALRRRCHTIMCESYLCLCRAVQDPAAPGTAGAAEAAVMRPKWARLEIDSNAVAGAITSDTMAIADPMLRGSPNT